MVVAIDRPTRASVGYPLTVGACFGVERAALLGLLHITIPKQLLDFLKLYLVGSYSLQAWDIAYNNSGNARQSSSRPVPGWNCLALTFHLSKANFVATEGECWHRLSYL